MCVCGGVIGADGEDGSERTCKEERMMRKGQEERVRVATALKKAKQVSALFDVFI